MHYLNCEGAQYSILQTIADTHWMSRKKEKGWGTKEKFLWQAGEIENLKEGKEKI